MLFARLDEVTSMCASPSAVADLTVHSYTKLRTLRFQQNLLLARTLAPPPRKSAPKGQPQAFKKVRLNGVLTLSAPSAGGQTQGGRVH